MSNSINEAASVMGKIGGKSKSKRKLKASMENLKKAKPTGRPPVETHCPKCGTKCGSRKEASEHCKVKRGK
jgi:anaerobic selenocysteine-containing dehydrogenase